MLPLVSADDFDPEAVFDPLCLLLAVEVLLPLPLALDLLALDSAVLVVLVPEADLLAELFLLFDDALCCEADLLVVAVELLAHELLAVPVLLLDLMSAVLLFDPDLALVLLFRLLSALPFAEDELSL